MPPTTRATYSASTASRVCLHRTDASRVAAATAKVGTSRTTKAASMVKGGVPPRAANRPNSGRPARATRPTWASRPNSLPRMTWRASRSVHSRYCRVPRRFSSVTAPATKAGVASKRKSICWMTNVSVNFPPTMFASPPSTKEKSPMRWALASARATSQRYPTCKTSQPA